MKIKDENYALIYKGDHSTIDGYSDDKLQNIVDKVFELLLADLKGERKIVDKYYRPYIYPNSKKVDEYFEENLQYPHRVAIDMIASMSDKYLLEFYRKHCNN